MEERGKNFETIGANTFRGDFDAHSGISADFICFQSSGVSGGVWSRAFEYAFSDPAV